MSTARRSYFMLGGCVLASLAGCTAETAKTTGWVIVAVFALPVIAGVLITVLITFLLVVAHSVESISEAAAQISKSFRRPKTMKHINVNVSGGQVGNINFGKVVGSIDATVTVLNEQGKNEVVDAIRLLTESITAAATLADADKTQMLEQCEFIAKEAAKPDGERQGTIVKSVLSTLKEAMSLSTELLDVWTKVSGPLLACFGF